MPCLAPFSMQVIFAPRESCASTRLKAFAGLVTVRVEVGAGEPLLCATVASA